MNTYSWCSAIGLGIDIMGVLLVFFYGFPSRIKELDEHYVLYDEDSPEEKERKRKINNKTKFWGYTGLVLLFFGFLLQLIGTVGSGLKTR